MDSRFEQCNLKIVSTIGKGTYGTVYLCQKLTKDNELTIIKDIPVNNNVRDKYQDAGNEVQIVSRLIHPNIIRYYENYYVDGFVMISMEYATNGNLAEYMYHRSNGFIVQEEVLFFFCQILLGVNYIHNNHIIHRDLKAENILLTGTNGITVKIGDFGIAKTLTSGQKTSTVIGTPYYLAPELCDGKPYDMKTDVWALGCLLYEMCTHKRAFESETLTGLVKAITSGNVAPISPINYERSMQDLIDSSLTILPEKRPSVQQIMGKKLVLLMLYKVYIDAGDDALLFKTYCTCHL